MSKIKQPKVSVTGPNKSVPTHQRYKAVCPGCKWKIFSPNGMMIHIRAGGHVCADVQRRRAAQKRSDELTRQEKDRRNAEARKKRAVAKAQREETKRKREADKKRRQGK